MFGGTPTAGNLLLCAVKNISAPPTVSGFTQIVNGASGIINLTLFAKISAGNEGTVTPSGTVVVDTSVCEYSGCVTSAVTQDGTAGATDATGSVTSLQSANITTSNAGSLIFEACFTIGTAGSWASATKILDNTSSGEMFCGQFLPGVTESGFHDTASWTTGGTAVVLIAGFAPAAPAGFILPTQQQRQAVMRSVLR